MEIFGGERYDTEDNPLFHYCWFGGKPKPDIVKKCMETWEKHCSGYEIKEWNEKNFDITAHVFMKEAYKAEKFAFVSDIARLLIIQREGGIYLDTDVEISSSLDKHLGFDAFFAFENKRSIATGLGFGAIAGHPIIGELLGSYRNRHFIDRNGKLDMMPCPELNTEAVRRYLPEVELDGDKTQVLQGCLLLSMQDYSNIAKHHGARTWVDGPKYKERKFFKYEWLKRKVRKTAYYDFIERSFGKKALKAYVFCSYDLLDCGIWYFVKRGIFRAKQMIVGRWTKK